jgi:hypothetical protein
MTWNDTPALASVDLAYMHCMLVLVKPRENLDEHRLSYVLYCTVDGYCDYYYIGIRAMKTASAIGFQVIYTP